MTKNKVLQYLVAVLLVICLVQGFVLLKHSGFSFPWGGKNKNNIDTLSQSLLDEYKNNQKDYGDRFDHFFDDDFFKRRKDPFDEMERMQRRMQEMMEKDFQTPFSNSWDQWFTKRFYKKGDDIDIQTKEESKRYVITISIPNLKENNLDVTVDSDGVHVKAEVEQVVEKKDSDGNIITSSKIQRKLNETFPIPTHADYEKAQMEYVKEKVIITLPKL